MGESGRAEAGGRDGGAMKALLDATIYAYANMDVACLIPLIFNSQLHDGQDHGHAVT